MRAARAAVVAGAVWVAAAAGAARGEGLAPAGDVDGDLRGDVLWVGGGEVRLYAGAALEGAPLWVMPLEADGVAAMAGDVDGDGLADVALGEPSWGGVGRVRVVRGGGGLGVEALYGGAVGERFGAAVAGVDLDGDGRSELLVGAPGRSEGGWLGAYRVGAGAGEVALVSEMTGFWALGEQVARVWDVDGDGVGDALAGDGAFAYVVSWGGDGLAVADVAAAGGAPLGDIDGDGVAELAWWRGEEETALGAGEVAWAAGDLDGDFVADAVIAGADGVRAVSGARDGVARRVLAREGELGAHARPIGDVDGDGFADIGWLAAGKIAVWRGRGALFGDPVATWRLGAAETFTLPEGVARPRMVLAAGADVAEVLLGPAGLGDVVVGLPDFDYAGQEGAGFGVVMYGSADRMASAAGSAAARPIGYFVDEESDLRPGMHAYAALTVGPWGWFPHAIGFGAPDFDRAAREGLEGLAPAHAAGLSGMIRPDGLDIYAPLAWADTGYAAEGNWRRGASAALVGDFDGDGLGDFVDVAPGVRLHTTAQPIGQAAFRSGADAESGRNVHTASHIAPERWSLRANAETPALAGISGVAALGDVNGDTLTDFLLTAPEHDRAVLVYGSTAAPVAKLLREVQPPGGVDGGGFGAVAAAAGDLDGDGYADLAIAAPENGAGSVAIFYGAPGFALAADRTQVLRGSQPGERFGAALAGAGDVDGDGYADLAIGAPEHAGPAGPAVGRVVLYRGGPGGLAPLPAWERAGERAGTRFGVALAGGLDWNADGFGDLPVAAYDASDRPLVLVFAGNDGLRGHPVRLRATTPGGDSPVGPGGVLGTRDAVTLSWVTLSPFPGPLSQEAEATPTLGGERRSTQAARGAETEDLRSVMVTGLAQATPHHVRGRVRFAPSDAPLQPASRWLDGGHPGLPSRAHVRTRANRTPYARRDTYRVRSGPLVVRAPGLLVNDFDFDGDRLRAEVVTPPARGELELASDGSFTYVAAPGDIADRVFTYRVFDGTASSEPVEVALTVRPCGDLACRDGRFAVNVALVHGGAGAALCRPRYDLEPPTLECETEADGTLYLAQPVDCADGVAAP